MDDATIRKALRDISRALEPLVIGPTATSIPAQRARYMTGMLSDLVGGEPGTWDGCRPRLAEWDAEQDKRSKGKKR